MLQTVAIDEVAWRKVKQYIDSLRLLRSWNPPEKVMSQRTDPALMSLR
jgi:hypothetical protein